MNLRERGPGDVVRWLEGVPMTSLRRLAGEQGRPLPPEPVIRDAIAAALS
jgi:hypothetical protein